MFIDQQLYTTRPSVAGRRGEEMQVYALLEKLQIAFVRLDHDPADTMEACRQVEQTLGVPVCKNLFLCNRQQTQFYLLSMPGDKPFKTKDLSAQIQSARLSFAGESSMRSLLCLAPGSVSVMGLMYDTQRKVRFLVDRDLLEQPYFACHPCVNTTTLKLRTADLLHTFLPHTGHAVTSIAL